VRRDQVGELREVHVLRPPLLKPKDRVAIVAPAGPVPREPFAAGRKILEERYALVHDERVFERNGFLAGSDEARLAELDRALDDSQVRAIVCARGGYGLMRILERLDARKLQEDPKWIVGFSDVTALHAWALRAGVESIHGPVVTQLGALPADDAQALIALLERGEAAPIDGLRAIRAGRAEGPLVGGNLEMITRLVGTPWSMNLDGAILVLEEVGERPYRVDRQLTQLELSGALSRVAAVVLGDFTDCLEKDGSSTVEAVLEERLSRLGIPVVAGAPVGHGKRNRALRLGAPAILDGSTLTLQ
jgi:muramoyltetrapeptide carboxypeptidase